MIHRARALEFSGLFLVGPALSAMFMRPGMVFPCLWLFAAFCCAVLPADPCFDRAQFWNLRGIRGHLRLIGGMGLLGVVVLTGLLMFVNPQRLLWLPEHKPRAWIILMVLYPIASVYPQELIFRVFFVRRYSELFRSRAVLIVASALCFGWAHIFLANTWAVSLSAIGGVLFARTYLSTRSLAAAALEHSMYGCLLFTIGWGQYFYLAR